MMGSTVNTMILGGMALAFSRVIDNSVISLENIYRHLELGNPPTTAAEVGGSEVTLAVLAATLVDVVDFFPVTFLYGVSKFLFLSACALVLLVFADLFPGCDDCYSPVLFAISRDAAPHSSRPSGESTAQTGAQESPGGTSSIQLSIGF